MYHFDLSSTTAAGRMVVYRFLPSVPVSGVHTSDELLEPRNKQNEVEISPGPRGQIEPAQQCLSPILPAGRVLFVPPRHLSSFCFSTVWKHLLNKHAAAAIVPSPVVVARAFPWSSWPRGKKIRTVWCQVRHVKPSLIVERLICWMWTRAVRVLQWLCLLRPAKERTLLCWEVELYRVKSPLQHSLWDFTAGSPLVLNFKYVLKAKCV